MNGIEVSEVRQYRKKPVVIEAMRWLPAEKMNIVAMCRFVPQFGMGSEPTNEMTMSIKTLEGIMVANPGDWVIKGVAGEFYPCKPDIFEASYEYVPT